MRWLLLFVGIGGIVYLPFWIFVLHTPGEKAVPLLAVNKDFAFDVRPGFPADDFEAAIRDGEKSILDEKRKAQSFRSWYYFADWISYLTTCLITLIAGWYGIKNPSSTTMDTPANTGMRRAVFFMGFLA